MRKWSKRTWLGVGLALVLSAATVGTVALRTAPPRSAWLAVQFLGYTNPPHYSRPLALFQISNRTDAVVSFDVAPEFQQSGVWSGARIGLGPGMPYRLDPHQTYVYRTLYPLDGRPYRTRVVYKHPYTRFEAWRAHSATWLYKQKWMALGRRMAPRPELRPILTEERSQPDRPK